MFRTKADEQSNAYAKSKWLRLLNCLQCNCIFDIILNLQTYHVNSMGKQWLGSGSCLTERTAFSPGTCLSTDIVSSVNWTLSEMVSKMNGNEFNDLHTQRKGKLGKNQIENK